MWHNSANNNPCCLGQAALLLDKEEISISVLPPHDALHLLPNSDVDKSISETSRVDWKWGWCPEMGIAQKDKMDGLEGKSQSKMDEWLVFVGKIPIQNGWRHMTTLGTPMTQPSYGLIDSRIPTVGYLYTTGKLGLKGVLAGDHGLCHVFFCSCRFSR